MPLNSKPAPPAHDSEQPRFHGWFSVMAFSTGASALATLIILIGFIGQVTPLIHGITIALATSFALEQIICLPDILKRSHQTQRKLWLLIASVIALLIALTLAWFRWTHGPLQKFSLLAHATLLFTIFLSLSLRGLRHQARLTAITLRPGWLLAGSFSFVALTGTLLLKMPLAIADGQHLTWLDSLFTSTSATCVTGLAIHDTATFFSPTGQLIILALIQFGGLGIMTITFFMASVLFQGMSLHDRFLIGEMIAERRLAHVGETLRFILLFTFITETLGTIAIYFALPDTLNETQKIYHALFHSISSFCNAGFSSFPNGLTNPTVQGLTSLQINITLLAIAGGLGSLVVFDTIQYLTCQLKRLFHPEIKRPRLRVHTRIVWTMTTLLLCTGWLLFFITEYILNNGPSNNTPWLTALFKSGATRTTGFNSVNTSSLSTLTIHLLIVLMFIGGSPGGTAGGLRTTVVATAFLHLWHSIRGSSQIVLFKRRLNPEVGPRALTIIILSITWLYLNYTILRQLQPNTTTDSHLFFELLSAFSTVGLSINLTPSLTNHAKILILINMFIGRIGLLTLIITLMPLSKKSKTTPPQEDILLV